MFKSHFINDNEAQKFIFRQYSNKLAKIRTASKINYFKVKLEINKNDPRKMLSHFGEFDCDSTANWTFVSFQSLRAVLAHSQAFAVSLSAFAVE